MPGPLSSPFLRLQNAFVHNHADGNAEQTSVALAAPVRWPDLPFDRTRRPGMREQPGHLTRTLGPATMAKVAAAAAALDCTPSHLLIAGLALLLHRICGQQRLIMHYAATRPENDGEAVIESQLSAGESTSAFVGQLRSALLAADLVGDACRIGIPAADASQPLEIDLETVATGVTCVFRFDGAQFDHATISLWMDCLVRLIQGMVSAPDAPADAVPMLSPEDERKIVLDRNHTKRDWGPFQTVASIVRVRAEAQPERVAVECAGVTWSNRRLLAFADALSQRLLASGVREGSLVAIAIDRSPEMVGAVIAVLMTGAAYLPLDPRHPRERTAFILADANAGFLLTTRATDIATSAVTIDVRQTGLPAVLLPLPQIHPETRAYVIYTSGSTGNPKGVAISHGALMNLLLAMAERPGLSDRDTLVSLTTLAFDIATMEILLPLITGARLVLATDDEALDGSLLLALLERSQASFLQATPGHWRILLAAGWARQEGPSTWKLRCLCGGEPLPLDLAEKILERTDELWNMYGPTETTIWSAVRRVQTADHASRIGPPIANTQIYVLDQHRRALPPGVPGELYIGGAGLAQGYWQRPDLTASRFVPNPYAAEGHSASMYATGDVARMRHDGTIDLLGRSDHQVKINGYRIELGEIESAIARDPLVREAAVLALARSHGGESLRLIAFLVLHPGGSPTEIVGALQNRLAALLPDYMLPQAFQVIARMPRTPNGKLDRKTLQQVFDPALTPVLTAAADREPGDLIEAQLIDIWQTTLGLAQVSPDTNFFSLGMGSLTALRLVARINRAFGLRFGIASLVAAPTIESVAELVRLRFAPNTASSVVALRPGGSRPALFLIHGVGGNIVTFYGLSARLGPDQPVYAVQAQSLVGTQPAWLRMEDMAASYIRDMRKVQPRGPYHLVGYSFGGRMALEIAQQLLRAGDEVGLLGMIDSRTCRHAAGVEKITPVQLRFNRRMVRFRGNTGELPLHRRVKYVLLKLYTRSIRLLCVAACDLRLRRVPSFLRSTWDINHVASINYVERPYPGRIALFRPAEQPAPHGPADLGWSEIANDRLTVHELPGDHDRIFLDPNIDLLAAAIKGELARAAPPLQRTATA